MRRLALSLFVVVALLAVPAFSQAAPFVYVANQGSVSQFEVGVGGLLSPLSPAALVAPSGGAVAVSPDGGSVYVTNLGRDSVSQYDVGASGNLTPKIPAEVPAGDLPVGVAVSPDGTSVYVTNEESGLPVRNGIVSQYDVDAAGRLSPKNPPTVAAGQSPERVAVSPDGRSAYVTNLSSNSVSQYDIGANGALTPKNPATVAATGFSPVGVAVSPDGSSVYVATLFGAGSDDIGNVSQYHVRADGTLAPKSPSAVEAGMFPVEVAVNPDGGSLYVTNAGSSSISQYDIGPNGDLTPKSPAAVATDAEPYGLAVSPEGHSVYVTNRLRGVVSQYDADADGRLSPKSPATVAAGDLARGIAVSPLRADELSPLLTVPATITVNATGPSGATVRYTVSATDNVDPGPDVVCSPLSGATFPIGTTKVTCTATDEAGNSTTKSFNVVVRLPSSKAECKSGGWRSYGDTFKNQGQCVAFAQRGPKP